MSTADIKKPDLHVLYEDNHLLVVEKPYGVPSQEDSSGDLDMLRMGKAYIKVKYDKPGDVFLGLVHRLDRPTRGVMVFARTSKAAARLSKQIQDGRFEKTYLAVLTAMPPQQKGTLTNHLMKDNAARMAKVVDEQNPDSKEAKLSYQVIDLQGAFCLVRVKLLTGRYHQIRAQFAHIGCGVYGDMKYGRRDVKEPLALFAQQVCLYHPTRGEHMCFELAPKHHPFSIFEV